MPLPDPLNHIAISARRKISLSAGQTLFEQSAPTRGLFFLEHGSVELRRFTRNGEMIILHRAMADDTFAEASLFVENFHCQAVAIASSRVLELNRTAILDCFATEPDFALAMTARLATQLQVYRRRIEIMAIRSADERVFTALSDGMLKGNIKSFAAEIGLSHEAVYRSLSNLTDKQRIKKPARGQYTVLPTDSQY